jgi:hypothetical protein
MYVKPQPLFSSNSKSPQSVQSFNHIPSKLINMTQSVDQQSLESKPTKSAAKPFQSKHPPNAQRLNRIKVSHSVIDKKSPLG